MFSLKLKVFSGTFNQLFVEGPQPALFWTQTKSCGPQLTPTSDLTSRDLPKAGNKAEVTLALPVEKTTERTSERTSRRWLNGDVIHVILVTELLDVFFLCQEWALSTQQSTSPRSLGGSRFSVKKLEDVVQKRQMVVQTSQHEWWSYKFAQVVAWVVQILFTLASLLLLALWIRHIHPEAYVVTFFVMSIAAAAYLAKVTGMGDAVIAGRKVPPAHSPLLGGFWIVLFLAFL